MTTTCFQQLLWPEETHTKDYQCQPNTTCQPFLSLPHFFLPQPSECKEEREGEDRERKKVINNTLLPSEEGIQPSVSTNGRTKENSTLNSRD